MEKISKKASSEVIKIIQKIEPSASKLTSWDQAWVIIAEKYNFEGSLISNNNRRSEDTIFELFKDDNTIKIFTWPTIEVYQNCDWDWTEIYKTVVEYIISSKLIKIPRKKRSDAKIIEKPVKFCAKTGQISSSKQEMNKSTGTDLESLKKQKMSLYHKIRNLKKMGKDFEEYNIKYNHIIAQIKKLK